MRCEYGPARLEERTRNKSLPTKRGNDVDVIETRIIRFTVHVKSESGRQQGQNTTHTCTYIPFPPHPPSIPPRSRAHLESLIPNKTTVKVPTRSIDRGTTPLLCIPVRDHAIFFIAPAAAHLRVSGEGLSPRCSGFLELLRLLLPLPRHPLRVSGPRPAPLPQPRRRSGAAVAAGGVLQPLPPRPLVEVPDWPTKREMRKSGNEHVAPPRCTVAGVGSKAGHSALEQQKHLCVCTSGDGWSAAASPPRFARVNQSHKRHDFASDEGFCFVARGFRGCISLGAGGGCLDGFAGLNGNGGLGATPRRGTPRERKRKSQKCAFRAFTLSLDVVVHSRKKRKTKKQHTTTTTKKTTTQKQAPNHTGILTALQSWRSRGAYIHACTLRERNLLCDRGSGLQA